MGMMLTGRRVSAKEGYELGFVTEVVPHAELMAAARRWASSILECSPMSVRATKQVVMRALDVPALEMANRNLNYPAFVAMTRSEDTVEKEGFRREAQAQLEGPLTSTGRPRVRRLAAVERRPLAGDVGQDDLLAAEAVDRELVERDLVDARKEVLGPRRAGGAVLGHQRRKEALLDRASSTTVTRPKATTLA